MTGLGVEQVFIQRVVGSGIGVGVETANLLGSTTSLAHSGVHLKALLGGGIAEVGALGVVSLLTLYDALVGSPQYVESLLVVVLAIIERRHPGSAVCGLVALSLCHKGIKCMQECAACLHIFLVGQEFLTLFHQCFGIALCLYCADMAADSDIEHEKEYLFHKRFLFCINYFLLLSSYLSAKVGKNLVISKYIYKYLGHFYFWGDI